MPRAPRDYRLDSREVRSKLRARSEPYWRQIVRGTFLGYRKGARASTWIARQRQGEGYAEERIGTPDDHLDADGDVVLTYTQAVVRAQTVQIGRRQPAPKHYGDGLTLNAVFARYLEDRQTVPGGRFGRIMPKSTAAISAGTWRLRAADTIGAQLVGALDARALRSWHAGLANLPPMNRGKPMPFDASDPDQLRARRNTANRALTLAKSALSWARRHELLPDDMPDWWRTVQPFALTDEGEPRMLDLDEITRLLNAAAPDLRELLSGAFMTGARYSELRGLLVRDYDPESRTVRIQQTKTYKVLRQPLTAEGVALFERLTAGRKASAHIFVRADGSPWGQSDATKPMRAAALAAGLEDVSFKTTRATYGKLLLVATRDIEMVARALGHSDSRITRKHYARYLPNEVAQAVATLPALGIDTATTVQPLRRASKKSGTRR